MKDLDTMRETYPHRLLIVHAIVDGVGKEEEELGHVHIFDAGPCIPCHQAIISYHVIKQTMHKYADRNSSGCRTLTTSLLVKFNSRAMVSNPTQTPKGQIISQRHRQHHPH